MREVLTTIYQNRRLSVFIGAFALLLSLFFQVEPCLAKASPEKMLVLGGRGVRSGAVRIYLSNQGILVIDSLGSALWQGPQFNSCLLMNHENHTKIVSDDKFGAKNFGHPRFNLENSEKVQSDLNFSPLPSYKLLVYKGRRPRKKAKKLKKAEIIYLEKVPLSRDVIAKWSQLLVGEVSSDSALPVSIYQYSGRFHDTDGPDLEKRYEWMHLLKIDKIEIKPVKAELFKAPAYRLVQDKADFMFSSGKRLDEKELDDLYSGTLK